MRSSLILTLCLALPFFVQGESAEPLEGRIVYDVDSGGLMMTYTFSFKGEKWRSELKSGSQVFDLRVGDMGERTAYLVNEGGKSYRMIGGGGPGMSPRASRGGEAGGNRKSPEQQLASAVVLKKTLQVILEHECRLEQLKGTGMKLDIWLAESPIALPGAALPRVKAFDGKERLLLVYFREDRGLPLLIEAGSGKKRFEMRAKSIEAIAIDESLVLLPNEYKPEGGIRPMGGGRPGGGHPGGGARGP